MSGFSPIKFKTQENGNYLYKQLLVLPSSGWLTKEDFQYFYNLIKDFTEKNG